MSGAKINRAHIILPLRHFPYRVDIVELEYKHGQALVEWFCHVLQVGQACVVVALLEVRYREVVMS